MLRFKETYKKIKSTLVRSTENRPAQKNKQDNQLIYPNEYPRLLQELEPRIMFDGAAIETVDLADGVSDQEQLYVLDAINNNDNAYAADSLLATIEANSDLYETDYSRYKEVIIIDAQVKDPHIIIESISRDASIEVILADDNGVDAITEILDKYKNLNAIHIISHGNQAQLQLGGVNLNESNLNSYQTQLKSWGMALIQGGDILFYGCNVAEGKAGQAFVEQLRALTESDIAASIDLTASINKGGDTLLEQRMNIDNNEIFALSNDYGHALADTAPINIISADIDIAQLGVDIDGEAADDKSGSSVSMSADGLRVAIGAPYNDDNGSSSGHVRIYDWNGSAWVQLGTDIDGEAADDKSGYSVSMSADGSRVAIGAIYNDDNSYNSGHVRIYDWNGSAWVQLGTDIDGVAAYDASGYSVSMSADGSRVAIGAIYNDDNSYNSGHVRIYDWNGSAWVQLGTDIDGVAAYDASGYSVSMSADGSRVAIGAPYNDDNGSDSGHVRIYDWNGSAWVQLGTDIDGEAAGDASGSPVSMSADGSRVAIGAPYNDDNGSDSGHVRIYDWNGSAWVQLGTDIDGVAAYDYSGYSVSMSADGSRVAIGAIYNNGNGTSSGHVRIYDWNGSAWVQLGTDIDGEAAFDKSGWSVSMSADGSRVAIGAIYNDGNGSSSGHVRVYSLLPKYTVQEDIPFALSGISVSDLDGNLAKTRLQVNSGILNVSLSGSATISAGSNNTNDLTISGSQTDINATLTSLIYQSNADFNGNDTLTISSSDSGSPVLNDVDIVSIEVTPVNDSPQGDVTISAALYQEGEILLAENTITDADGISSGINYQWLRDGVAIAGATSNTYSLTNMDVGHLISVNAIYIDDNGASESLLSGSTSYITNTFGEAPIDINGDGTIDAIAEHGVTATNNGDGTFILYTENNSAITLPILPTGAIYPTKIIESDPGVLQVDANYDASNQNNVDVFVESGSSISITANEIITTTQYGSVITIPLNSGAVITDNGTSVSMDADGNGVLDIQSAPSGSTITDNSDGSITTATVSGSTITTLDNAQAVITDDGTSVSMDADGNGVLDIQSAPSGSSMVSDGSQVTTTLAGGEEITTAVNSQAVITDNGSNSVTVTNSDGSEIVVDLTGDGTTDAIIESGMTVADAGSGNIRVTDSQGDSVTLPVNSDAAVSQGAAGILEVDLDNDGTNDVTVPNGSTVVDNGDGTQTITDPNGDSVTLPINSNAIVTAAGNGELSVDLDGNGTIDATVPAGSSLVDNTPALTFSVTTANGSSLTLPNDSQAIITDDGSTVSLDTNGDGTADVTAASGSSMVSDGSQVTTTLAGGEEITTAVNSQAVITDNGSNSVTVTNSDGSEIVVDLTGDGTTDAIIESGMTVADAGSGNIRVTDSQGDSVTLPVNSDAAVSQGAAGILEVDLDNDGTNDVTVPNGSTVVDNGDGTQTITDPNGDSVTLPINSNAIVTAAGNGELSVDLDGNGTIDATVPAGSSLVDNTPALTFSVTTANGSSLTLPNDSQAIITDDGSTVSLDTNGDGTADVTAASGSSMVSDGSQVTTTLAGGEEITTAVNSQAVITDNGSNSVTVTNSDGSEIVVDLTGDGTTDAIIESGMTVADAGSGNIRVTDSQGDSVTLPVNSDAAVSQGAAGILEVDLDNDGTNDVTVPNGSTVVDNGDGTQTITDPNGDSVTLPINSNAIVTAAGNGELSVDLDGNGTIDATVPAGSSLVDNTPALTFSVTTANGSSLTLPNDSQAIITDDGSTVSLDTNGDGTADVTAASGSSMVSDGSQVTTTLAGGEEITTAVNSQAVITDNGSNSVTVTNSDGSEIVVDLTGDGTTDAIIESGMTVADAGSGNIRVTDSQGDSVTLPVNSDAAVSQGAAGILEVDLDNDGTNDVTVPNGSTVVDNGDGTVSIDTNGDGTIDTTINADSNAYVIENPNGTLNIDFGGDGVDVVLPQGATAIDNGNDTITVVTANGQSQVSANQNIAISDDLDGTVNFDVGNDGINDIVGDAGIQVIVANDGVHVVTPNGVEVTVPANENVAIQDDPVTSLITIDFGNNGIYDVKVPNGSVITSEGQNLIVKTASGDNISVQKDSQSDVTVPAVNVYLDRSVIAVQPNAQGEYLIGGAIINPSAVNIADRSAPVDFNTAFSGFAKNTVITLNQETFESGSGTIDEPFSAEFQSGGKAAIASLLSSDNVQARITGVTPDQGQIETVLNGNQIDISFIANPNFSGEVNMVLDVYQNDVLVDKQHFRLKVIQTADVITESNGQEARQGGQQVEISSSVNLKADAAEQSTAVTNSNSTVFEKSIPEALRFNDALNAKAPVEVLKEIAANNIKSTVASNDAGLTADQVAREIVRQAIDARESPRNVGIIAAGMVDAAIDTNATPDLVIKSIIRQVTESSLNTVEVSQLLSQMILETEDEQRTVVIDNILAEDQVDEDHIVQILNELNEIDPEVAEEFSNQMQSANNRNNALLGIESPEKSSGLLSRLKAKIFGIETAETNYSEAQHAYQIKMVQAELMSIAKNAKNKDKSDIVDKNEDLT